MYILILITFVKSIFNEITNGSHGSPKAYFLACCFEVPNNIFKPPSEKKNKQPTLASVYQKMNCAF